MKYSYEGAETGELIQNYKTSNDKIIITFLDGSNYEIPLTQENENDLLNQMLEQAQERSESSSLYDAKKRRIKALIWTITQVGFTMLGIFNYFNADSKCKRIFASVIAGITALTVVIDGLSYKFSNDEIKELEKYDIYLSIREKLENANDPNLFNGIIKQGVQLNINTLDNYSLNDIKKIRDNLKRSEMYSSYFNKEDNNPTLTKKIGK